MRRTSRTIVDHAHALRKSMTPAERRLWKWLRDRSFGGYKFRRQCPVDRYVLDFYCPELKLAVEADGRHHEDASVSDFDDMRTLRLNALGIQVVRIANETVLGDTVLAEQQIRYWIEQRAKEVRTL